MEKKIYYYIKNVDTGRYEDVTSNRITAYRIATFRNKILNEKRYIVCPRIYRPEFSK